MGRSPDFLALTKPREVLMVLMLLLLPGDAQACSVCVGWSEGQGLNEGFYWSALLLTLLPFGVATACGLWVRRALRRRDAPGSRDRQA